MGSFKNWLRANGFLNSYSWKGNAVDFSRGVSNIVNPKDAEYTAASPSAVGLKFDELDEYKKLIQNEWLMNSLYENLTEDGIFNKADKILPN